MNKEEFHKILRKPDNECDGLEMHLQLLWKHNNSKVIFELTGLDFGQVLTQPTTSPLDYWFKSARRSLREIIVS